MKSLTVVTLWTILALIESSCAIDIKPIKTAIPSNTGDANTFAHLLETRMERGIATLLFANENDLQIIPSSTAIGETMFLTLFYMSMGQNGPYNSNSANIFHIFWTIDTKIHDFGFFNICQVPVKPF